MKNKYYPYQISKNQKIYFTTKNFGDAFLHESSSKDSYGFWTDQLVVEQSGAHPDESYGSPVSIHGHGFNLNDKLNQLSTGIV